jgi:hypothetical protein
LQTRKVLPEELIERIQNLKRQTQCLVFTLFFALPSETIFLEDDENNIWRKRVHTFSANGSKAAYNSKSEVLHDSKTSHHHIPSQLTHTHMHFVSLERSDNVKKKDWVPGRGLGFRAQMVHVSLLSP